MTDAGIYTDMTNEDYHAATEWLSSSQLKAYLPEHYKTFSGSRDALDFGTAFHAVALADDSVTLRIVHASSWRTKAAEEARAAADAEGGVPILAADFARIEAMVEALGNHATAGDLLYDRGGTTEESVFAEVDGVPCKARFDKRIDGVIIDLKSTSARPGADSLRRAVIDYGYDLSAAHYLAVAQAAGLDVEAFALIFVGKTEPYHVTVAEVGESFLERGRALRAKAIARHYRAADAYEGASGFVTLDCPRWAVVDTQGVPA